MWVIENVSTGEYWSNRFGWTDDLSEAERFTAEETTLVNLPMEGDWRLVGKEAA